jgi:Leucine-rich repeat (LRR) protein
MRTLTVLISILFFGLSVSAQTEVKIGSEVFSENYFDNLDAAAKSPEKVVYLDLSLQKLKSFPEVILTFKNLEKLLLPYNYYPSIPNEIGQLDKVKELDISGSYYMNHLPIEGLKDMESLEKIIIKDHKLVAGEIEKLREALPSCTVITD